MRFPALLTVILIACSSSKADEASDPDVQGRSTNPEGVPYPTDHIGSRARLGTRPGDRIENFTFTGYPNGDRSKGPVPISLADYFDPDAVHHKILHIQAAATWCAICSDEARATHDAIANDLVPEGVVYLEVIVSGASAGIGPSDGEVDTWMTQHQSNYSTAFDVRARRLGSIGISGSVMPWDVLVDTRTMEILDSSGGSPGNLVQYDQQGLALAKASKSY